MEKEEEEEEEQPPEVGEGATLHLDELVVAEVEDLELAGVEGWRGWRGRRRRRRGRRRGDCQGEVQPQILRE